MENKIQELTDKIYREGVEKGNQEAQRLVDEARKEAQRLVDEARSQADNMVAQARKQAAELEENTKSELKLFARQAVDALKTEVADLLAKQTVTEAVKGFTDSKDYFNRFVVTLASQWTESEPVVISAKDGAELKKYFVAHAKELLDKGVEIKEVNGMKALFSISPASGAYKVDFGKEEFENYFKEFLRPQLVEMLF